MADGARSDDPALQHQLDRLSLRSPGRDTLGLERIRMLLDRLGRPQDRLPPVFHVAGTNGKGSTVAFLRAMLEASGHSVHVYTSPHLVRFNERIRLAGRLVEDAMLADALARVIDTAEGIEASFFEATTAAALTLFARIPADACVIEVGLGGRLDATNVIASPASCGIASLGIDHGEFLLAPDDGVPADPMARIAFEKAGIARHGIPLVTQRYGEPAARAISDVASDVGARWLPRGSVWSGGRVDEAIQYMDAHGMLMLPLPVLAGAHQVDNALLAAAMLRHQSAVPVAPDAIAAGVTTARWPARMQRIDGGPLLSRAGIQGPLWLDGGHNVDAAIRVGATLRDLEGDGPVALVMGMLANKDADGFIAAIAERLPGPVAFHAVPIAAHACWRPDELATMAQRHGWAAVAHGGVEQATGAAASTGGTVAVLGSLYLAGEILRLNRTLPD